MSRPADKIRNDREVDVTDRSAPAARRDAAPARDAAPTVVEGNGAAIGALVTGLLAATFAFLVAAAPAAILFGIIAIALGAKGMSRAKSLGGLHKGLALSGLLSGLLGLLLGAAVIIGGVTLFSELQDRAERGQLPQEIQQPVDDLTGS
jgi:hypothetical protein